MIAIRRVNWVLVVAVVAVVLLCISEASAKKKKKVTNMLQKRETNPAKFVRLIVMRLVWGFAKMFGMSGPLGEVLDGAFVPPGADDDDDDDYDDDYF